MQLAVDSSGVYWTAVGGSSGGEVTYLPFGGTPTGLAGLRYNPDAITIDSNNVYWGDGGIDGVWTLPKSGGTPSPIAIGVPAASRLAVDSQFAYWSSSSSGSGIYRAPLSGGAPTTLVQLAGVPFAINADYLYYTPSGWIWEHPLVGGADTLLAPACAGVLGSLALDASHVYWACSDSASAIGKVPITGGTSVFLTAYALPSYSFYLKVGATAVCAANYTTVYCLTPK